MGLPAVIAGTGMERLPEPCKTVRRAVETPSGPVELFECRCDSAHFLFLPGHGRDHDRPPHEIDSPAHIAALAQIGTDRILATNAVGSLRPEIRAGSLLIPNDFIEFTRTRPAVHGGVFVCVDGPWFETPAEARRFSRWGGDVIGMTGVHEAIYARELGICYATLAIVTNLAAGLSDAPVHHDGVLAATGAAEPHPRGVLQGCDSRSPSAPRWRMRRRVTSAIATHPPRRQPAPAPPKAARPSRRPAR